MWLYNFYFYYRNSHGNKLFKKKRNFPKYQSAQFCSFFSFFFSFYLFFLPLQDNDLIVWRAFLLTVVSTQAKCETTWNRIANAIVLCQMKRKGGKKSFELNKLIIYNYFNRIFTWPWSAVQHNKRGMMSQGNLIWFFFNTETIMENFNWGSRSFILDQTGESTTSPFLQ